MGITLLTRRSVEHCTPHADVAWLNELGWSQYNSCIFMVKLRNCFFRKQNSCDEILSTFMKITRVNKLKNKTKFNTNINNVMKCHENHKSKQCSSRHSLLSFHVTRFGNNFHGIWADIPR